MKKTLIIAAAFAFAVILVACVPSPTDLCKTNVTTTCKRMFECNDAGTLAAIAGIYGANATECQTKLETLAKCSAKTSQDDLCKSTTYQADGGTTETTIGTGKFDLGKASSCNDKTLAESCADFLDATKTPDDCKHFCGQ